MQEFTSLIGSLISSPFEFIITGDFNLHVDDPASPPAASFLSVLDHFGLSQHVTFPTHRAGHTLDLLVTRTSSEMIHTVEYCSFTKWWPLQTTDSSIKLLQAPPMYLLHSSHPRNHTPIICESAHMTFRSLYTKQTFQIKILSLEQY